MLIGLWVLCVAAMCGYVESQRDQFKMDNHRYYQVGVMENKINGDTFYLPIYKRN